jgi:hypothetical protein
MATQVPNPDANQVDATNNCVAGCPHPPHSRDDKVNEFGDRPYVSTGYFPLFWRPSIPGTFSKRTGGDSASSGAAEAGCAGGTGIGLFGNIAAVRCHLK